MPTACASYDRLVREANRYLVTRIPELPGRGTGQSSDEDLPKIFPEPDSPSCPGCASWEAAHDRLVAQLETVRAERDALAARVQVAERRLHLLQSAIVAALERTSATLD